MLTELEEFNKKLLTEYETSRLLLSINCVMPGYFSGTDILFVAQNPGLLKNGVEGDELYLKAYENKEFEKLNEYYVLALQSSRGTYGTMINDVYGTDWSKISLTNVFKCPFQDNIAPKEIPNKELEILEAQFKLLNPKDTIAVGSKASAALNLLGIFHYKFFHPSYLKVKGIYNETIQEYKSIVDQIKSKRV